MNDSRGLRPEVELEILRRSGIASSSGYEHQPDGIYGCDAKNDIYRFIEARHKDWPMSRCCKPSDPTDPRTVGVMISIRHVDKPSLILFVVECPGDAEEDDSSIFTGGSRGLSLFMYQGYRAVIDPKTAAQRLYCGVGRGAQPVYFIPVADFERVY